MPSLQFVKSTPVRLSWQSHTEEVRKYQTCELLVPIIEPEKNPQGISTLIKMLICCGFPCSESQGRIDFFLKKKNVKSRRLGTGEVIHSVYILM